jgi:hypothetical protein
MQQLRQVIEKTADKIISMIVALSVDNYDDIIKLGN